MKFSIPAVASLAATLFCVAHAGEDHMGMGGSMGSTTMNNNADTTTSSVQNAQQVPSPGMAGGGTSMDTDPDQGDMGMGMNNGMNTPSVTTGKNTILDIAVENGLTTLVAAAQAAGLANALGNDDGTTPPVTLFAPTDVAFDLSGLNVTRLLQPQWQPHLSSLLEYHVVPSIVLSSQLMPGAEETTLEGSNIKVTSVTPDVLLNGEVDIIIPDIAATNGCKLHMCFCTHFSKLRLIQCLG